MSTQVLMLSEPARMHQEGCSFEQQPFETEARLGPLASARYSEDAADCSLQSYVRELDVLVLADGVPVV